MQVFNTLAPVFLIIALGALLRWRGFISADGSRTMNQMCYWVGLPCLLFVKIGLATPSAGAALTTINICLVVTAIMCVVGLVAGLAMRMRPAQVATMVHVVLRGNQAYVGLPIVIFGFAGTGHEAEAEAVAALTLGPLILAYNFITIVGHLLATHGRGVTMMRRLVVKVLTNPLILSCALGLLWNTFTLATGVELPTFGLRSLNLLGSFTLPVALLCVGCGLADTQDLRKLVPSAWAGALKTCLSLLLAVFMARLLGAGPVEAGVALVMMATPTAVASYVMVEELEGDTDLAAGAIVMSTLISLISLSVAVSLIG